MKNVLIASLLLAGAALSESFAGDASQIMPESARLTASPGDTTYFIDPVKGDDSNPPSPDQ
jgi:hypothetical protein